MRSSPCLPFIAPHGPPGNCSDALPPAPGPLYLLPHLPFPQCSHIRLQFFTTVLTQQSPLHRLQQRSPHPIHPALFLKGPSKLKRGLWTTTVPPHAVAHSSRALGRGACGRDTLSVQNTFQMPTTGYQKNVKHLSHMGPCLHTETVIFWIWGVK